MNNFRAIFIFLGGLLLLASALFAGDTVSAGFTKIFWESPDYIAISLGVFGLIGLIAISVSLSQPSYS